MALSGKFSVGQPVQYGSIYAYQKFKFPVLDESGARVGWAKQERIVDENGEESGVCYYTRDLPKPYGAKRFYSSPQALIIACGGQIDRTAPNPLIGTVLVPGLAKIIAAVDAQDGEPDDLQADDLEDNGPTPEENAEMQDPAPTAASAESLAEFLAKGPPPQPADVVDDAPEVEPACPEANAELIAQKADLAAHNKAQQKSASAKKGVATRAANKLAADKLVKKEARAAAKAKKLKAAKRVAKKLGHV